MFFDYQNYSNNGQVVYNKKEVSISYTYDKNNKFYDKNWIENNFNKKEVDLVNNQILENRKNTTNSIKKQAKFIFSFIALAWLLLFIVFGILYYIYYR